MPPNVSQEELNQTHLFSFKSMFVGTILNLVLKKEVILIQSDNISAITIIKVIIAYNL